MPVAAVESKVKPKPPAGLGTAGKRVWDTVVDAYELDAAEVVILEQAAQTADLVARMEREVRKSGGLFVKGSTGQPVASPLLAELRQQRAALTASLARLNLPSEDDEERFASSAAQRSAMARDMANARWRRTG